MMTSNSTTDGRLEASEITETPELPLRQTSGWWIALIGLGIIVLTAVVPLILLWAKANFKDYQIGTVVTATIAAVSAIVVHASSSVLTERAAHRADHHAAQLERHATELTSIIGKLKYPRTVQ
jgi:Na+/melibiose symporter-like transporter